MKNFVVIAHKADGTILGSISGIGMDGLVPDLHSIHCHTKKVADNLAKLYDYSRGSHIVSVVKTNTSVEDFLSKIFKNK